MWEDWLEWTGYLTPHKPNPYWYLPHQGHKPKQRGRTTAQEIWSHELSAESHAYCQQLL